MVIKQRVLILVIVLCLLPGFAGVQASHAFQMGNLKVGGAIRANYINGDYADDGTGNPQRGDNGGNFEDFVYYYGPEPKGLGDSIDSTRYAYYIVDENSPYATYEEKHQ